jgi:hypothetical protein
MPDRVNYRLFAVGRRKIPANVVKFMKNACLGRNIATLGRVFDFLYCHKNTPKVLSNFWGAVHFETDSSLMYRI